MEEYVCFTKNEAIKLIEKFNYLVGTSFIGHNNKRNYIVKYLFLVPSEPQKQLEVGKLLESYSLGIIPFSKVQEYTDNYTEDKFSVSIFATTLQGDFPSLFHLLPLQVVVDDSGQIQEGFAL